LDAGVDSAGDRLDAGVDIMLAGDRDDERRGTI
jgi:hypothetical protein